MEETHTVLEEDEGLLNRLKPQGHFKIAGSELRVQQRLRESVGAVVWEAELVLCRYLEACSRPDVATSSSRCVYPEYIDLKGKRVLELGAGTGLAGMLCAMFGASEVVLTDREEILDITFDNIRDNMSYALDEASSNAGSHSNAGSDGALKSAQPRITGVNGKIVIQPLLWGQGEEEKLQQPFDVVLAADLLYNSESHEALVKTLTALCRPETTVILVQKWRNANKECPFLMHAEMAGLEYEQMRWGMDLEGHGRWTWSGFPGKEEGIQIYKFRKCAF
mmetsp:Transcript_35900/g.43352  ORF Transcript_35900/g.43352 Transcript_35900/m.43352 type:complete len:278 (+) Transcript_35900:144-977(+)|eukprot:CAMPEP_0197852018 /NCGR_PEP_ID=MMETSP1438-20131217/19474_1 /TAXON_ID=1461541 /ORGANISM="Pterosperma sp., Strain CCMP1384" /LENGTH=277 /DNA_ID=CAMNT_0043465857 /DNA_START=141 /DNA_END=974 /DNA_ORIENTATION=+